MPTNPSTLLSQKMIERLESALADNPIFCLILAQGINFRPTHDQLAHAFSSLEPSELKRLRGEAFRLINELSQALVINVSKATSVTMSKVARSKDDDPNSKFAIRFEIELNDVVVSRMLARAKLASRYVPLDLKRESAKRVKSPSRKSESVRTISAGAFESNRRKH